MSGAMQRAGGTREVNALNEIAFIYGVLLQKLTQCTAFLARPPRRHGDIATHLSHNFDEVGAFEVFDRSRLGFIEADTLIVCYGR